MTKNSGKAKASVVFVLISVLGLLLLSTSTTGASPSPKTQNSKDFTVDSQVGIAGVVPAGNRTPVRLRITSTRARTVQLTIGWGTGQRSLRVELGANAPTEVDLAVPPTEFLDVTISESDSSESLANKTINVTVDPNKTIVAIGKSLFSQGAPKSASTIGGIQQATLVELNGDLLNRPGALQAISGVFLSAADVDSLDTGTRDALRDWVWAGGNLALDFEASDPIPVVDLPRDTETAPLADGASIPVGSGWVRFTNGAAALGGWSSLLEPSTIRDQTGTIGAMWMGNGFPGDFAVGGGFDFGGDIMIDGPDLEAGIDPLTEQPLIKVSFLPTWLIALAIFGTALAAGPLSWFALRTRNRRRLMWFAAPGFSLLVTALLMVLGQGVFSNSRTSVAAGIESSPWGARGLIFSGLQNSKTFDLSSGADLIASQPEAIVSSSGGERSVNMKLPRNGFGSIGVGPTKFEEAPQIEVKATAKEDGLVSVSVTNHSSGDFTGVVVRGNSRSRRFDNVGPGKTATLDFKTASDLTIFNTMFPQATSTTSTEMLMGSHLGDPLESRGLIRITGTVTTKMKAEGLAGTGGAMVGITVPVNAGPAQADTPRSPAESAALRIDEVGGWTNSQLEMVRTNGMFDPPVDLDENGNPIPIEQEQSDPIPEYVRFTFPHGRASAPCGVSVLAPQITYWNGVSWVVPQKDGATYQNDRLKDIGGNPAEMQDWVFPQIPVGGRLYVKVDGRTFFGPPAMLFDCGGRP
ncbi:MAG: hypothetical protein KDB26_09790 [Microthrixaceae bacterium]|nr:hypothetical protein [Microthrixaceae bacterium]